jgi:hypothetical protein
MTRAVLAAVAPGLMVLMASCSPVRVESPDLVRSVEELGKRIDGTSAKYLVDQLTVAQDEVKRLEQSNKELAAARDHAEGALSVPYEIELACDATPASQSEITTTIDGARGTSVGCPARSGLVAIQQTGRLHVELHVANETAGYTSFSVRLWHGKENVWMVTRSNPMTKTDGCKQGPDRRIECAFDAPFELGKTDTTKVRTIDRQ